MKRQSYTFLLFLVFNLSFGQSRFKPTENYIKQSSRASELYIEKNYVRSAELYDKLFKTYSGRGLRIDRYNAACAWSLAGNKDQAFHYLNQSLLTNEWVNLSNIASDSDLSSLHNDKRWQILIDKIRLNNKVPEQHLNKPLIALLDTIYTEDQTDRNNLDIIKQKFGWQSKQIDSVWNRIRIQDSVNLARIKFIISVNGWPGPNKIGEKGSSTIFLVIQHADSLTQITYLPIMRTAVKNGNARSQDLALLEDRVLTYQGKEQIYGTQIKIDSAGNCSFFPIKDEVNVNKRRLNVGLGPLEYYAKYFGIKYILSSKK